MRKFSLTLLTFFLSAMFVFGQSTTGKLVGTISDPSGAVVPGATVTVTDNQTGKTRNVTATDDGTFEVSQLEFGTYSVKITASGYKTFSVPEVKIDAGREYPLKAQLEVGQVSETVTVTTGAAEQINSSDAALSSTVSREQIRELPLNGRNPLSLLNLTAGANPTTSSINGQRSSSTTVTRDGLNVQDNFIRTGVFVSDRPTVDDTGEFTVITQNAGAESGVGSSQVQLVTPRGGSKFHGNLYEFNRNSQFTSNGFFNNAAIPRIEKPFLNRNQFGGSISGPVPIFNFGEGGPTFLKGKAFFFFNYEQFRQVQQVTINNLTTLLPPARNGTFTYVGTDGVTRTVNVLTGTGFDFTTGTAAAIASRVNAFNNGGGALTVDPIIQSRILNRLPTTANGVTTGINYLQTLSLNRGAPTRRDAWSTRFDYEYSDRSSINLVYKRNNELNPRTDQAAGFATAGPYVFQGGPTNFLVGAWRYAPFNNFSNEFRAGFQYSEPFFQESQIPSDYLIGGLPVTSPEGSFRSQGRNTLYRNFQDNAVYTIGNHSFRFGGQAEFYKFESKLFNGITQSFNITTTTNPNTPAAIISGTLPGATATDIARANTLRYFLAGIVGSGTRTANLRDLNEGYVFGPSRSLINFEIYSGYIQDQWRVRPDLTFNLGLRYDYFTPLNGPTGLFLEPVFPDPNNVLSGLRSDGILDLIGRNSGTKGDFFKPDKNNFEPNFSFAYSPKFENGFFAKILSNSFVIRGGFRLNVVNDEYAKAASTLDAGNAGLGSLAIPSRTAGGSVNLRSTLSPTPFFDALPASGTLPGVTLPPRSYQTNNNAAGLLGTVFGVDPNYKVQQNMEYNIGIQREIGFKTVFEIRYVGGRSDSAVRTIDYNQIDINNNGFLADFRRARENCRIQGATLAPAGAFDTAFFCTNANNIGLPGQQTLTVFPNLAGGGSLTNTTNLSFIQQNRVGSLVQNYISLAQQGSVVFQPTSSTFAFEILTNGGKYRYNALQMEVRRRFTNGLSFQVNYTYANTLADIPGDANADQNRQGAFLDNNRRGLDYGRPDYQRDKVLNANAIFELPFGKGKRFLNKGGLLDKFVGGFQISSIVNLVSGPPLGIIDPRSTFNITSRSGRQSATTTLSESDIKDLVGPFNTPNGIYLINPKVLCATANAPGQPQLTCFDLFQPLPAGYTLTSVRAASSIGTTPFAGQVFFFNEAGSTGNMKRNFLSGTPYLNWDAGISKSVRFGETMRLQLRAEFFNVLNKQVPFFGADLNIDSNSFGRVTSTYNGARIIQFGLRFDF